MTYRLALVSSRWPYSGGVRQFPQGCDKVFPYIGRRRLVATSNFHADGSKVGCRLSQGGFQCSQPRCAIPRRLGTLKDFCQYSFIPRRFSPASHVNVRWIHLESYRGFMTGNVTSVDNYLDKFSTQTSLPSQLRHVRHLHASCIRLREESKVEETLEALKDTVKKATVVELPPAQPEAEAIPPKVEVLDLAVPTPEVVSPIGKKSLWQRFVAELKHYYHGFRLLFIDVRVCVRLLRQLAKGQPLMRREQQQLVRTTADMFRLVPFLVFILVPFAEFLLPFVLKFFPGMLPSTFKAEDAEQQKRRKHLKLKLEMAKFLQDTIEEMALQRKDPSGESAQDFVKFMEKIRVSGVQTSNEEILKFSKLFEDEITLDNLDYEQLRALCRLVDLPTVGTSYFLRFQLQMKLRQLEADDRLIKKEGIDSLAVWELQEACRTRGMRSLGVPETRLKSQLSQWLDLHLNHKIPSSLLLLSRTLYLPEHLSAEDQLKATISVLPESTAEEAKVKISEVAGDRVDNKSKLEVIRQEEEIIQREKKERKLEEEAEKLLKVKAATDAVSAAEADLAAAKAAEPIPAAEALVDKAVPLREPEVEKLPEIDSEDLGKFEDVLEHMAGSKRKLRVEVDDLKALKEDVTEYQENLEDVRGVVKSSGGALSDLSESKAAVRLSRKVNRMISQMDEIMNDLAVRKEELMGEIQEMKDWVESKTSDKQQQVVDDRKKILKEIAEEQNNLITLTELQESLRKLQNVSDSSKFEMIAQVLDEDRDGVIDYTEAMKVIELLSKEDLKLSSEQVTEIMDILRKEKEFFDQEKLVKSEERKQMKQQPADQQAMHAIKTAADHKDK